jgi:serine/threonine protein kinase
MFVLLSGKLPFVGSNKRVFELITSGDFSMDGPEWDNISEYGKDLIRKMLQLDPNERITASQALEHPWIKVIKLIPHFIFYRLESVVNICSFEQQGKRKVCAKKSSERNSGRNEKVQQSTPSEKHNTRVRVKQQMATTNCQIKFR